MTEPSLFLGPVRRWKDGDIYCAENDFIVLAWAATDDPAMVGKFGWHGLRQIGVEYISRETAAAWEHKYGQEWASPGPPCVKRV